MQATNVPIATGKFARGDYSHNMNLDSSYSKDQVEFLRAIDQYKRENHRPFPSWSEVLEVALALGYRKVAEPEPLPRVKRAELKAKRKAKLQEAQT